MTPLRREQLLHWQCGHGEGCEAAVDDAMAEADALRRRLDACKDQLALAVRAWAQKLRRGKKPEGGT